MTRRLLLCAVALLIALPVAAEQHVFARDYDLNTPTIAATTNYLVTSVNLTNTTFAIAHQPDVPRNVTGTVTDTTPSVTAGTITFTGTDVNGDAQTEVWNLATALTFTGTKVFATVSATAAGATTLGGAGDETIVIGVGSVVGSIYCSASEPISSPIRVKSAASSTTVTTVGLVSGFGGVQVGDELFVRVTPEGTLQRRVVTAKASTSSLTVDSAVSWSNSNLGFPFAYRHTTCGYGDTYGWIATNALADPNVKVDLGDGSGTALTATGGLNVSIECRFAGDDGQRPAQVLPLNMTTTLRPASSQVIPIGEACSSVRVGLQWGTVDTAGTDSVTALLTGGHIQ